MYIYSSDLSRINGLMMSKIWVYIYSFRYLIQRSRSCRVQVWAGYPSFRNFCVNPGRRILYSIIAQALYIRKKWAISNSFGCSLSCQLSSIQTHLVLWVMHSINSIKLIFARYDNDSPINSSLYKNLRWRLWKTISETGI